MPDVAIANTPASRDPLDDVEKMELEEDEELVRDLRRAKLRGKLREAEAKARGRNADQEDEEGLQKPASPAQPQMPVATLDDAAKLADMPPDRREMVLSVYQTLNLASNPKANQLLPLMLMFANKPTPTTQMDLQGFSETMLKWMDKGMQFTQQKEGGGLNLQEKIVDKLLTAALEKPAPASVPERQSLKEEVATLRELRELFPESTTTQSIVPLTPQPNQSLELEKIRGEQDVKKLELSLSHNREMAKIGNEGQRYTLLKDGAETISGAIGYALGGGEMAGLEQSGQVPATKPGGASTRPFTWEADCPACKAKFDVPDPNSLPIDVVLKCPRCGTAIQYPTARKQGQPQQPGQPEQTPPGNPDESPPPT